MGKSPETRNPFKAISDALAKPALMMLGSTRSLEFGDFLATRIALDGFKYRGAGWEEDKLVITDGYINGRPPFRVMLVENTGLLGIRESGAYREYGKKRTGDSWDGQYHVFSWDPDGALKQVEVGATKYHGFFYKEDSGWKRQDTHNLEFFRVNRPDFVPLDSGTERQLPHILTGERKVLLDREIPWKIDYAALAAEIVAKAELEEFIKAFKIQYGKK